MNNWDRTSIHRMILQPQIVLVLILSILSVIKLEGIIGISKPNIENENKEETVYCSYAIDVDNMSEVINHADYFAEIEVLSFDGYTYRDPVKIEYEEREVFTADPYSVYTIKVCEPIKGDWNKGSIISVMKFGGLLEDKKTYLVIEGDTMLKENSRYFLTAYEQKDGTLLVFGKNSSIPVDYQDYNRQLNYFMECYKKE